ncbi:MAG TPA: M67 family metallopeptidase [Candidatus Angelobacter sp.]|jgi:proteasome lid subunit RPN8/RPN11|nr:M67 family metallopeptidase [Candidatus Angelobacter sp.]
MLKLRQAEYDAIRRHGEETYPHECCGVLLGTRTSDTREVLAAVPCDNARTDTPQTRYSIDPRELVRVQREARERGLDIVGFYHSHPDHPARWSVTDLQEAHWIGCSYVITAVENGKAAQTNSFVLTGTREEDKVLAEEEIMVKQPPQ